MRLPPVYHVRLGHGAPLVVLGGVHFDHTYLRPWLDKLAEHATIVYLDVRGTGKSEAPADLVLDHSVWLRDVHELVSALGPGPITLSGHSYGGCLAQEYALKFPQDLNGLILANTAPASDYVDTVLDGIRRTRGEAGVRAVLDAWKTAVSDQEALRERWLGLLPLCFHGDVHDYPEFQQPASAFSARAFNAAYLGCLPKFNTLESLGHIRTPTLVLGGRHDWIVPVGPGLERLAKGIPHAHTHVFERSGHFPFAEEHDEFHSTVREWRRTAVTSTAGLTRREMEVALLLQSRATSPEIASTLGISTHTARRHVESVLRKLRINSRRLVPQALARAGVQIQRRPRQEE